MKHSSSRKAIHFFIAILFLITTAACGFGNLLSEDSSQPNDQSGTNQQPQNDGTSPAINNSNTAVRSGEGWLVMLYQDADDDILERDVFLDLNEAEIVGSSDQVTIVSQLDRYDGEFEGDGDWTTTKRFLVQQDDDLEHIRSQEIVDLGEMDMSDPQTLEDFAVWAIQTYPAAHYALILSDHGMGWLGGWTDPDPNNGDMSLKELDSALSGIVNKTGIGQIDFFGFDACLMAQLETMSALAPYAQYAAASEETEPAVGWAYAAFLQTLVDNPDMTGAELAREVVNSYIDQDYRITDADARVSFIEENYDNGEGMSAREVAADMSVDTTISAIDLSQIAALNEAMNEFALVLSRADQSSVAAARAYSQSYESVFEKDIPDSYFDLGNFIELAEQETGDNDVAAAGQQVLDVLSSAVIAEKHGDQRPGSTGLAFYFPNSELYEDTTDEDYGSYTGIADRFAAASLWDDFLVYYYTGKTINPEAADLSVLVPVAGATQQDFSFALEASAPEADAQVESPGRGEITVSNIASTADEIGPDETVTISADISGNNIAFIYYYVDYYSEEYDSYLMAEMGYLNADSMHNVGGLIYPDWGDGEDFPVEFPWSPTVYYLSDGKNEGFAYLEPEVYGETYEEDIYTLYGLYAPGGDESHEQEAMLRFDGNFDLKSFWVFTDVDGNGAPRQATFKEGDTFSIWELWEEYNTDADEWEYVYYLGDTLTYTGTPFSLNAYYAFPGLYEVGIMAEDYDGNSTYSYTEITVPEY